MPEPVISAPSYVSRLLDTLAGYGSAEAIVGVDGRRYSFTELRQREFSRLDANRVAYLDYAGSALYAESQVSARGAIDAR